MITRKGSYLPSIKMLGILVALLAKALGQDCKFSTYVSPTSGSHIIRSPRHPALYPPSSTCYWYYYTDVNYRLNLDCYDVEMGLVPWECSDSLTVVGSLRDDGTALCSPFNSESIDRRMMLILSSTERSRGGRFTCSIRAIRKETCDCGWSPKKRIVGGKDSGINEFPFMVSIVNARIRQHACGAAIISPHFVVTAAHCLKVLDVNMTGILVGEHDMSTGAETDATRLHRAAEFIVHPDYNQKTTWNDIGLIRSETMFEFNSRVGPICLPFNRPLMPPVGEDLTTMGWGTTSFGGPTSDVLQKVKLRVVSEGRCKAVYNQTASSGKQVCTFTPGKDTCQMDSGGPLISYDVRTARMFLAALVSFGSACGGDDPAVNTRITPYVDWIQQATNELYCIK